MVAARQTRIPLSGVWNQSCHDRRVRRLELTTTAATPVRTHPAAVSLSASLGVELPYQRYRGGILSDFVWCGGSLDRLWLALDRPRIESILDRNREESIEEESIRACDDLPQWEIPPSQ